MKVEDNSITKPDHYCKGRKYEPRKVIYDWGLDFNLGSAVKYISRAGRKGDKLEDLKKAVQFLQFEIEELEQKGIERIELVNSHDMTFDIPGLDLNKKGD